MSLRTRLWLVIGALALLPLLVGGVVASLSVPRILDARARDAVRTQSSSVAQSLHAQCETAGVAARATALDEQATNPEPRRGSGAGSRPARSVEGGACAFNGATNRAVSGQCRPAS